jgi:hypothetical protein
LRHFGLAQLGGAKLGQGHSAHPQRGADQHGREPASRLATRIGLRQQYLAGVCHSNPVHGNSSLTFKRIKKADGVGPSNFCAAYAGYLAVTLASSLFTNRSSPQPPSGVELCSHPIVS